MKNIVDLEVNVKDKLFMFKLGRIFAAGKRIRVKNNELLNTSIAEESEFLKQYNKPQKSFNMMIKFWQDNNLSPDIKQEINSQKIFLICPVRDATKEEIENLNSITQKYLSQGYKVHYPEKDTVQSPFVDGINTGGYNICLANAKAIYSAGHAVVIYYNKKSTGTMFDLGVASYLQEKDKNRTLKVENYFDFDPSNPIDIEINKMANLNLHNKIKD